MKLILSCLFLLGLVGISIQCSPPGIPGWTPLTVEELARRAPLVIKAYLVKSFAQDVSGKTLSRRCLFVTQVYRGSLHLQDANYICADKFGSSAACRSDLSFGRPFIVFLNKLTNGYEARYDEIHSAVRGYSHSREEELRKGLCCSPNTDCDKQLPCSRNSFGVIECNCGLGPTGSVKGGSKGANPPGPPTRGPRTRPGPPGPPGN